MPFYTHSIFVPHFSSAGNPFNFCSAIFYSTGTFLYSNLTHYLIDVTPSKSKHQMSKICETCPFIPIQFLFRILVPLGTHSIFVPPFFIPLGPFCTKTTLNPLPDRCYPFKVQTSNEQNL